MQWNNVGICTCLSITLERWGGTRDDPLASPCSAPARSHHHLPANPFIHCAGNRTKWINANLYYKNCRRCTRTSSSHRRIRFNALAQCESFIYNRIRTSPITSYKHLQFDEKLFTFNYIEAIFNCDVFNCFIIWMSFKVSFCLSDLFVSNFLEIIIRNKLNSLSERTKNIVELYLSELF